MTIGKNDIIWCQTIAERSQQKRRNRSFGNSLRTDDQRVDRPVNHWRMRNHRRQRNPKQHGNDETEDNLGKRHSAIDDQKSPILIQRRDDVGRFRQQVHRQVYYSGDRSHATMKITSVINA
ncbi:MAG: hypothetical protein WDN50_01855 [Bradyrhizobium sp.]